MRRFVFPLVVAALGAALIVLTAFLPRDAAPQPNANTNGSTNRNASTHPSSNTNAIATTNAPAPANTNGSPATNVNDAPTPSDPAPAPSNLPAKVSLNVPFTSQAPTANWSPEFNDACEEASAIMVAYFWQKKSMTGASATESTILAIENWETANIGHWESTTAAETVRFIEGYWPTLDGSVKAVASMDDVRRELAAGRPVILPANGRELGNPYFRSPGPPYHMLVVTGYDAKGFITNDPGTRHGEDYRYSASVLFNAIHDWQGSGVADGPKVMVVVTPKG